MAAIPKMEIPKRSVHRFPVVIRTALNLEFVDDLKRSVPKDERTYDDKKFIWRVSRAYQEPALLAMLRHWPEVQIFDTAEGDHIVTRDGQRITQTQLF